MLFVTKTEQYVGAASQTSNVDTQTVNTTRSLDSVTNMKVCRVCLAMNVKMYQMSEHKLSVMYERVTGFVINTEDDLTKMLCWECVARLSAAHSFVEKASKTNWFLVKKLKCIKNVTISDIEAIDRAQYQLVSSLGFKYNKENYSDFNFVEESNKIYEHQFKRENNNYCEDTKVEDYELNDIGLNNYIEEPTIMTEVNITDEKDPIKREYLDTNEEQSFAYEAYIGPLVSIENNELKFQNLETQNYVSIKESIDNVSEMSNKESQIFDEARELCEDVRHSQRKLQRNRNSDSLPHCKELKVVVENIMLSPSKNNAEDPLNKLANTDELLKERTLYHPPMKTIILEKKKKLVKNKRGSEDATISKQFFCDNCGKKFKFKSSLIRHIRRHPKIYSCTYCSYKSNDKTNLRVHVNARHTKTNVYDCPHCSHKAYNKSNLSTHINAKHTKTNFHNCSYCSYKAYDKRTLTRHINCIHTRTKVYSCSLCNYKAYDNSILARHVNAIHTKKNVHNCSYCNYKAYEKKTLTRHINAIHTKTKVYSCSLCSYKAYDTSTLTKHVNAKHN